MWIRRSDLPRCAELNGAAVVIDTLRSFTTIACAFAQGARDPAALAVGGGAPAPGLDLGNSPARTAALDLRGWRIVQYTAAGTRGLVACDRAVVLLAASLVCTSAAACRPPVRRRHRSEPAACRPRLRCCARPLRLRAADEPAARRAADPAGARVAGLKGCPGAAKHRAA